jgi:hypothetical protein
MEIDDAVKVSLVFYTDYILNEILEREYKLNLTTSQRTIRIYERF